jgi:putative endonuclease
VVAGHLTTGRQGEDAAERHLRGLGFVIVARNWRRESLELDFICVDRDPASTLVFVEVKTRAASGLQRPIEALGRVKQQRLSRAASLYLSENACWDRPCRFDLICVTVGLAGELTLEHHAHVFDLSQALGRGHAAWQPW